MRPALSELPLVELLRRRATLSRTFRALRHRDYRLFWFGQMVSLVGTWVQDIAQNWLVYRLTGSAAMLGWVNFVGLVPAIPVTLWAGSLADRLNKRYIVLGAQLAMLAQATVLAVLTLTDVINVWHVMALAFVFGVARAIDMPSRQSFIIEMVGKEDLTNAIALNSTVFNAARVMGPAVAGLLVVAVGEGWAFGVNALSFVPVVVALVLIKAGAPATAPAGRPSEHIAEGIRYARTNAQVWVIISLVGVAALFIMPYSVLMPVYAREVLGGGADTYGFLMTCTGVGALVAALAVANLGPRSRRGLLLTAANLVLPALVASFAFVRTFWLAASLLAAVGFSFVVQNALANTLLQLTAPDHLRGRVMSIYFLVFMAAMRLGALQAGGVAHYTNVRIALLAGGVMALSWGAVVAWRYPALRRTR